MIIPTIKDGISLITDDFPAKLLTAKKKNGGFGQLGDTYDNYLLQETFKNITNNSIITKHESVKKGKFLLRQKNNTNTSKRSQHTHR